MLSSQITDELKLVAHPVGPGHLLGNCASSLMKGKLMATKKHEAGGTTSHLTSLDSLGQSTCAPTGSRMHFAQQ
jgi:hypothetical protein